MVALGVEWAAKPQLEARKNRLLAVQQARWQMWRCLFQILAHAYALAKLPQAGPNDDTRAAHEAVVPATRALEEAFREATALGGRNRLEIAGVLASYVGAVRGVMASDRTWRDKGQLLVAWTPALMDVLGGPGQPLSYRLLRRRYRAQCLTDLEHTFADRDLPASVPLRSRHHGVTISHASCNLATGDTAGITRQTIEDGPVVCGLCCAPFEPPGPAGASEDEPWPPQTVMKRRTGPWFRHARRPAGTAPEPASRRASSRSQSRSNTRSISSPRHH